MSEVLTRGTWLVSATLVVALFLTMLPLPAMAEDLRPQWVAMILVFWALALPERWILSRLSATAQAVSRQLREMDFAPSFQMGHPKALSPQKFRAKWT